MEPFQARNHNAKPEMAIQRASQVKLRRQGWFSKQIHGNSANVGFPDSFAHHPVHRARWIEYKLPKGSRLERSQAYVFEQFERCRVGVWILTSDDLAPLWEPPNWRQFKKGTRPEPIPCRIASGGAERQIQEELKAALRADGWFCLDLFSGTFGQGWPDFYACHADYGSRFIEVKVPGRIRFTPAQKLMFPEILKSDCGIWLLTSVEDLGRLYAPANCGSLLDTHLDHHEIREEDFPGGYSETG